MASAINISARAILLLTLLVFGAGPAVAGDPADWLASARQQYFEAQAGYTNRPHDALAAWGFGRACFDLAEFATNRTERAALATQGIAACRLSLARQSNSAAAHFYLAMNLGQLARTKTLGALSLVDEMETEFLRAGELDPLFWYAGPDRNVGQLYRDAPAIGSVGSRSKARKHLSRAVELVPDYPENRLCLIESLLKWSDRNGARRELKLLETLWLTAKTNLTGDIWAPAWVDWEARLAVLKRKLDDVPKTLRAPSAGS
jgi:hypothetical protein